MEADIFMQLHITNFIIEEYVLLKEVGLRREIVNYAESKDLVISTSSNETKFNTRGNKTKLD